MDSPDSNSSFEFRPNEIPNEKISQTSAAELSKPLKSTSGLVIKTMISSPQSSNSSVPYNGIDEHEINGDEQMPKLANIENLVQRTEILTSKMNEKLKSLEVLHDNIRITLSEFEGITPSSQVCKSHSSSSLSSEISNISEQEMDLNNKVIRLVQNNYKDMNNMKLKNIVTSTFELLNSDHNGDRLFNVNKEVSSKSGVMLNKLEKLIESFTNTDESQISD